MERRLRFKYTWKTTWNRETSDHASRSKQLNGSKSCLCNVSKPTYFWLPLWLKDSSLRYCSESNRNNSILWDNKGIRLDSEATSSPKCSHVLLVCQKLLCVDYLFQLSQANRGNQLWMLIFGSYNYQFSHNFFSNSKYYYYIIYERVSRTLANRNVNSLSSCFPLRLWACIMCKMCSVLCCNTTKNSRSQEFFSIWLGQR